jgi:putative Mg2+ transporter-C (MgtC) family protein
MNILSTVFASPYSDPAEIIVPLALAMLMGFTIGIERYIRGRPAGLRTYILVCVAFTTIALLSETFFRAAGEVGRADPARLAAGGLTGIGFLGAGVIVRNRSDVFGLTTAASIWTMAVIGLALGARHYMLASTLYGIALAALWLLRYLERFLPRETFRQIALQVRSPGITVEEARQYFKRFQIVLHNIEICYHRQPGCIDYVFFLHGKRPDAFVEAFESLVQREGVQYGALQQQGEDESPQ